MTLDKDPYKELSTVERSRAEAKKHYDRISGIYDYIEGAFEKKYRDMALDSLEITTGESVIEIGCGTGHALKSIASQASPEGKVIGLDISSEMCKTSKKRLSSESDFDFEIICGDAVQIPLKDSIFDKAFMSFTLELFSEKEIRMVLGEINRVLKEEGKFCVVSLSREEDAFVELYEIFHDVFPRVLDCRPIHPEEMLKKSDYEIETIRREKMGVLPIQIVTAISR